MAIKYKTISIQHYNYKVKNMTMCRKHKHSGFQKMGKTSQIDQIIKTKKVLKFCINYNIKNQM